jgi:methionyl-tRNA formyltransferase
MKVHIATSRDIGRKCHKWAERNLPDGAELVTDPNTCDVFISVMYGHLVSEEFISKRRCYNFHPGILPQYRGSGAFSWTIINGDKRCGVTLHELDVDIDTGPIIAVESFSIEAWDTAQTLHARGMEAMQTLFERWFVRLLNKEYPTAEQNNDQAHTYYRKDLQAKRDLTRIVRAFTFGEKEPAYYTDRNGNKIELRW